MSTITWNEVIRSDGQRVRCMPLPAAVSFRREGRCTAILTEPLPTFAGSGASPYCCYFNTVIFYARDAAGFPDYERKIDQIDTQIHQGSWTPCMVWWRGCWWEIGCGSVRWDRDRVQWVMDHRLQRNGRPSEEWNGERWIYEPRWFMRWWWYWPARLTRPLRDLLRMLGVWPGKPGRGREIAWKVVKV